MSILSLINCAASAIEDAQNGLRKQLSIANVLACSYLSALVRDIVCGVLTYPETFSRDDFLPEIAISFIFILLYFKLEKYRKYLEILSVVSKLLFFLHLVDIEASTTHNDNIVAVLSAIIIMFLGELTASAFSCESVREIILSISTYQITAIVGAVVYVMLTECGAIDTDANGTLAFYTLLFVALHAPNIRTTIKQYFIKLLKNIQQNDLFHMHLTYNPIFFQMRICNELFFYKLPTYDFTVPTQSYIPNKSVVFLLHQIRRM